METSVAIELDQLLRSVALLPGVPETENDIRVYFNNSLADSAPDCPLSAPFYGCDADGLIDSLVLHVEQPPPQQYYYLTIRSTAHFARNLSISMRNYFGRLPLLPAAARIEASDVVMANFGGSGTFPFDSDVLILRNVSAPDVVFSGVRKNFTLCSFENVTFRCPIPAELLQCYTGVVTPPCLSTPAQRLNVSSIFAECESSSYTCNTTCLVPPSADFDCLESAVGYFPVVPGFSTIELVYGGRGEATALQVVTNRVQGLVTRLEVFNWQTLAWTLVFDEPQPVRQVTDAVQSIFFPPILTNRARVTVEQWLPEQHVIRRLFLVRSDWPASATYPPTQLDCPPAITLSARSMLDETVADSFCLGRICQFACRSALATTRFSFGRMVLAHRLVIVGSEDVWQGGRLVAIPSANTRVYELDGTATDSVLVSGVRNIAQVRLVGDPVVGGLPGPSQVPAMGRFSGMFIKRFEVTVPAGGAVLSPVHELHIPNESIVSTAVVQNVTFATTRSGTLWARVADGWMRVDAKWSAIATNHGEEVAVRSLVAIGDRLLVVVSANTNVHDGSVKPLLIKRLVVQSPIDAMDVSSNQWYNDLLQHAIKKNISDIDIVQWNASAFAVVDRASGNAALLEWLPFPIDNTRACESFVECESCFSNDCHWCTSQCVAQCEDEIAASSRFRCNSTTFATLTALHNESTLLAAGTSTWASIFMRSDSDNSTVVGLAVGVPIAVAVCLVLLVLFVFCWKKRAVGSDSTIEMPQRGMDAYDDVVAVRQVATP
jgi:hypothetical protein